MKTKFTNWMMTLFLGFAWSTALSVQNQAELPGRITREWKDANGVTVPCQIFLPLPCDKAKKYPLVLCLHGSGEMRSAAYAAKTAASTALLDPQMRAKYPAFILVPQTTVGWVKRPERKGDIVTAGIQPEGPALKLVMQGMSDVIKEFNVDADRVYVSGQSMGGVATWNLILHHPDVFAAAVPICGVGDPQQAAKIRCPVWAFHGAKDRTVPVACSRDMVAALKQAGREVKYTEFPDVDHGSWGPAWNEPELAPWLFAKRRVKP